MQKYGVIPNLSAYAVHKHTQNESTQYVNFKHEDCQGVQYYIYIITFGRFVSIPHFKQAVFM